MVYMSFLTSYRTTEGLGSLKDLRKLENIRKISKFYRIITSAQSSFQNESFVNTSKKF